MDWTLQAIEVVNNYLKPGLQGIATLTTLGDFNADGTLHAKDWHIVQEVVTSIANCGVSAKEILRFGKQILLSKTLNFHNLKGELVTTTSSSLSRISSTTRAVIFPASS